MVSLDFQLADINCVAVKKPIELAVQWGFWELGKYLCFLLFGMCMEVKTGWRLKEVIFNIKYTQIGF